MCARPRTISDEQILEATLACILDVGPNNLTLAHVAERLQVSAPAIVRRFGTKRALLLTLASMGAKGTAHGFKQLRSAHRSALAAIEALAGSMAQMGSTPKEIAHTLAFLQIDLIDPEFHAYALESSTAFRDGLTALVEEAIDAGDLSAPSASRLASALQATLNGSLLNWAIHREGTVESFMRADLESLLAPHRTKPARAGRRRR